VTIPNVMQAARFYAPGDIRLEEMPTPVPGTGDALLAIRACGICGTDSHIWQGFFPLDEVPRTLGHEFAGEVVAVGEQVGAFVPGDRVVADINIGCGECVYCHRNQRLLCPSLQQLGIHRDGGFAEYMVAPAATLRRMPDGMSFRDAALVEPVVCALHGQDQVAIAPGESLVILGAGPMGLIHIMLAKMRGAAPIVVTETNRLRLECARQVGADIAIDATDADISDQVLRATGGEGADVVIEAVGSEATYRQATSFLRSGGRLLMFGAPDPRLTIPIRPFDVFRNEWTIVGSFAGTYRAWPDAIALLAQGRLDTDALVTSTIELADLPAALDDISGNPAAIKVQVLAHPSTTRR
jgi:threonine dehydrogenase-like Zn-dependent dehydrogenase